jgi:hypothetical protein
MDILPTTNRTRNNNCLIAGGFISYESIAGRKESGLIWFGLMLMKVNTRGKSQIKKFQIPASA